MLVTLGWTLLASLVLQSPTTIRVHARSAAAKAPAAGRITLWTDQEDPYVRGQSARVFLSVDEPSYVAVLRVDTDGRIRVLFPRDPRGDTYVSEDRTFEVSGVRGGGRSFIVDDFPGMGYLFAVASASPLDFDDLTRGDYWDYRLIDGGRVQGDPYVALTDLADRVVREGEYDYDVVPYYVGRHYDYPRFVCYDCHAYASYDQWNPYRTACTRFRVVIRDDPRYYPYRSGYGRNVVIDRPQHLGPRYVFRDADPRSSYVTRVPGGPGGERRRTEEEKDRGRTSEDVGGPGAIAAPGLPSLGRNPRREPVPELSPARPLIEERRRQEQRREERRRESDSTEVAPEGLQRPPRSTGEPELRRRRP
jgi:Domain of unknown function (DUF4384)